MSKAEKPLATDVPMPKPNAVHNLTLKELYKEIGIAIKNGLGDKKVLISDDDEGNGYHMLFFSVTEANEDFLYSNLPVPANKFLKEYVILG